MCKHRKNALENPRRKAINKLLRMSGPSSHVVLYYVAAWENIFLLSINLTALAKK